MTEAVLRDQLANALGGQGIDLTQVVADPEALQLVPEESPAATTCCRLRTTPRATC
jgi:hypothetical protein